MQHSFGIIQIEGGFMVRGLYIGFTEPDKAPGNPVAWMSPNQDVSFRHLGESFPATPLYAGEFLEPDTRNEDRDPTIEPNSLRPLDMFFDGSLKEAITGEGIFESQHWVLIGYQMRDDFARSHFIKFDINFHGAGYRPPSAVPLYAWRAMTAGRIQDKLKDWIVTKYLRFYQRIFARR